MNREKSKSDIGKKVLGMAVVSILVVTTVFFVLFCFLDKEKAEMQKAGNKDTVVALNEISNLAGDARNREAVQEKIHSLREQLSAEDTRVEGSGTRNLWIFYGLSILCVCSTYLIVYLLMLRPFAKLEKFAGEIANGNLDTELKYERVHMFGQFTWAFDHMRREIKRARQCEKEAVENNKTVIATLSHDIKTPIASIRAYSEALEANMDSSPERRQRYIDVIIRKCDDVTKITNDMFMHSLHDLDKLVMKKEKVEIHHVITETVQSMQGDRGDIILEQVQECILQDCDRDRIAQVLENLINNARKYAPGKIYVSAVSVTPESAAANSYAQPENGRYIITVKDCGKGIPDEDMPFIFDKFYRGRNTGEQPGAGLGLFIVKYIMEQMGGSVSITNHSDGMEVRLSF